MPRHKKLIKRSCVEVAKRRRTCIFTSESITKGSVCLVVYDGPRDRSCYSRSVALEMIRLAREQLYELEQALSEDQDG